MTTIGKRCRHTRVPCRADMSGRRVLMRCTGCGKRNYVRASRCEACWERAGEHQHAIIARADRYMQLRREGVGVDLAELMAGPLPANFIYGCSECFLGLNVHARAVCCCRMDVIEKCEACNVVGDPLLAHVCTKESAEEIAHDMTLRLMPSPGKSQASAETKARAAAMDQSQGIRVKHYD